MAGQKKRAPTAQRMRNWLGCLITLLCCICVLVAAISLLGFMTSLVGAGIATYFPLCDFFAGVEVARLVKEEGPASQRERTPTAVNLLHCAAHEWS